jgi:hypothetical protein
MILILMPSSHPNDDVGATSIVIKTSDMNDGNFDRVGRWHITTTTRDPELKNYVL